MMSKFKSGRSACSPWAPLMTALLATLLALPAHAALEVPSVPPSSGNGVPPNILFILDDSGSMAFNAMPMSFVGSGFETRSYVHNTIYYNPFGELYQPWMQASGSRMTGGTSYSAAYSSFNFASGNTVNLLDDSDSNCEWEDMNGSSTKVCGGTQTFYVPKDPSNTDPAYLAQRENFYQFRILKDSGSIERREYTVVNGNGGWRNATFATPTGRTEAEERTNYATWFSYHRTRMKVAKAGASEAFSGLAGEKYRVGFTTIWGPNGNGADNAQFLIPVGNENGLFQGANRDTWFETLFKARGYNGTPLLPALERAGEYYSDNDDDGPYGGYLDDDNEQFQCRQNFSILTTDGYWNSGSAGVGNADNSDGDTIQAPDNPDGSAGKTYTYEPEAPFKGANATTLADVAMHYWKTDLRDDMANVVPISTLNPAFWQHMVTFGISIGLAGTVDQRTVREVLEQGGVTQGDGATTLLDWPDPTTGVDDERKIDDLLHAAVNGHGEFVAASDPSAFAEGLKDALGSITNRTSSASNVSASSTSISTDTRLFQAKYIGGDWTGEISAFPVDETGIHDERPVWEASKKLPAWNNRDIYTTDSGGAKGTFPTAGQVLGTSPKGHSIADYIRGNDSGEMTNGGDLRTRQGLLGDVIHSSPYYVKDTDTLYVGANDGMLHAFDADDGREDFAYVPRGIKVADLRELASPDYAHTYFVDGPVVVSDRAATQTATHPNGRNILVGTLGRGGKGVFGLDVTTPASFGTYNILFDTAGDADMGLVLGQPLVAKLNDGSVSVIFGNGINSANESAVLWIMNVDTGIATKLGTGATGNNGLSAPRGWDSDGNGTVDLVYAGDQLGNLWKFDLSEDSPSKWAVALGNKNSPQPLFIATDASGNRQPISGRPSIGIDPVNYRRWVFFGTGRMLNDGDLWEDDGSPNLDIQTMYGIIDNGAAIGSRAANDNPNDADGLVERSIAATGSIGGTPVRSFEASSGSLPVDKQGWFVDLLTPPNATAEGERITGNAQLVGNVLITSSIIPSRDPCQPGGRGYINAVDAFTGASVGEHFFDVDGDGIYSDDEIGDNPVGSIDVGVGMPTDGVLIDQLIGIGGSTGQAGSVGVNNPAASGRVSWREVLRN